MARAKLYPQSHVEVSGLMARYYDELLDIISAGRYGPFVRDAIRRMEILPAHVVLDLGAGTGRNTKLIAEKLGPKGKVIAFEIGEEMLARFRRQCGDDPRIELRIQRIDEPFEVDPPADHALVSFVLHGLPHPNRLATLQNVAKNLKPGGFFHVLDFSPRLLDKSRLVTALFRALECPLAWEYLHRPWEDIFRQAGFERYREHHYFWDTVRLLTLWKVKAPSE